MGSNRRCLIAFACLLLVPAAFGRSVRYRTSAQLRGIESAILRERGQSASDWHDAVAHHVSVIIVQAERIASESNPDASVDVLAIIEEVPIANAVGHVSLRTS